ncbi:30S ribosomal protein S16 [Candidatus Peregrinibacteria bacterium]|nr:MAG: 30S ribosomal protein S16 [Candidatus Peregrinibacteria bacterium]
MLVIRMQRTGRKNAPFYHIVVAEKSKPVQGKFLERLGYYNPLVQPKDISLQKERVEYWISVGAQPSQTVARLCTKNGISQAEKFIKARAQKPSKAEEEAAKKKAEAEEAQKKATEEEAQKKAEEEKTQAEAISSETSEASKETPEKAETESE